MADRKVSSSRPDKPKNAPENVVSRVIRRLSPTKRYRGGETSGASSSPTTQKTTSGMKDSSATKAHTKGERTEKLSKSLQHSTSSSNSNFSQLGSPWLTPSPSYQSLNQDERAVELKFLSQLHPNFDEATNILG